MDKYPLIGVSICAVVLLVLGSLSNVVGYQSVKSTVNDSPLFQTRTKRATNQQTNSITSQYLGMGRGSPLQFQSRDSRTEQLNKVIDVISKMDDKTFTRFTELCIRKIREGNTFSETNNEIIQMLQLLQKQSKTIILSFTNKNKQEWLPTYDFYSVCIAFPGCWIILIVLAIIFAPLLIIMSLLTINCSGNLS
jgi:hypothetical protein